MHAGRRGTARRYSEEALAICESRSDSLETSRIIANLGFFERTDGNVEASLALTRRAIDLARETRQPGRRRALAVAIYYLAGSLLAAGELDTGLAAAEESVAMADDLGNPRLIRMARGVLVDAHWRRGDLKKALALLRLNLAIGPVDPWRHVVDLARMAALLIASEKLNGASGWPAPWKSTVSDLASTWAPLLHPLGKWSRRHSSKGPEQWAGARRASSPPGRRMSLEDAVAFAREDPQATLPDARVTPREVEVARLVRQGFTDPQIAKRLFISKRTAEGHVESLREHIGCGEPHRGRGLGCRELAHRAACRRTPVRAHTGKGVPAAGVLTVSETAAAPDDGHISNNPEPVGFNDTVRLERAEDGPKQCVGPHEIEGPLC